MTSPATFVPGAVTLPPARVFTTGLIGGDQFVKVGLTPPCILAGMFARIVTPGAAVGVSLALGGGDTLVEFAGLRVPSGPYGTIDFPTTGIYVGSPLYVFASGSSVYLALYYIPVTVP